MTWARPLKLLYLNHNLRNDGTYFRALPMAQSMVKRGHEVTLLTVTRELSWRIRWSDSGGVRVGETPNLKPEVGATGYGLLDIAARSMFSISKRFDIIHSFDHKPNATIPAFLSRALRGSPVVADWADWWGGPGGVNDRPHRFPFIHKFEEWWEIDSKIRADAVVTISRVLRERAISLGYPSDKAFYIPTGAPVESIVPLSKSESRKELGLPLDSPLLGFVGISQDDLEILFEVLVRLPHVRLLLVGPVSEASVELAKRFQVLDRVIFPGRIHGTALSKYLASADVLCLPMTDRAYNRGRLPNKLLDYLASGRPILSSPIGDVETIFQDFEVGVLAHPQEYAGTVGKLLQDGPWQEQLGKRAREVAETKFDWKNLAQRLEKVYQSILKAKNSS